MHEYPMIAPAIRHRPLWIALIFLALFTRFYNLASDSLWLDEAFSLRTAMMPFDRMFHRALNDPHPPLYPLLLYGWVQLFGSSESAGRSLSAIANLLTLPLLLALAQRLFNRRVAVMAGLLFLFSPYQIYFAQEVRSYSLLGLLSLASVYTFLRLLERSDVRRAIAYLLSTVLLIYLHVYGWLVLLLENLWVLYRHRRGELPFSPAFWAGIQGLLLVLFLPYLGQFLHIVGKVQAHYWLPRPTLLHLAGTLVQFSGSIALALICGGLLVWLGFLLYRRREIWRQYRESLILLLGWGGGVVLVPFLLSQVLTPFYLPRYVISATVPFYLLVALSIAHLPRKRWSLVTLAVVLLLSGVPLTRYYREPTREPWREMVADLRQIAAPDEMILLPGFTDTPNWQDAGAVMLVDPHCALPDAFLYYAGDLPNPLAGFPREYMEHEFLRNQLFLWLRRMDRPMWFVSS
ncbi:MAG: hypothetical protein D6681_20945, partial [Calditrichaeota bacterium]